MEQKVTQKEFARWAGYSDKQVGRLIEKGVLVKGSQRGKMDLLDNAKRLVGYLKMLNQSGQAIDDVLDDADDSPEEVERRLKPLKKEEDYLLTRERRIQLQLKNEVTARKQVPTEFAIFSLSKLSSQIGTILDGVVLTMKRKHPDLEPRHLDSFSKEIAEARNKAAALGDDLPRIADEFFRSIELSD